MRRCLSVHAYIYAESRIFITNVFALGFCLFRSIDEIYDALAERLVPTAATASNPNSK